jgi:hypothetical protein
MVAEAFVLRPVDARWAHRHMTGGVHAMAMVGAGRSGPRLVGAWANDQAVVRIAVNDWGGGRLDVSDEGVKRRVFLSQWGWRLIMAATVCGIIATIVQ